jgi:hypothetical protein
VVCGSCSQRQQELQQLLAAYPASALPAAGHATQPRQPQQQATTLLCDAASPEGALHAWALARGAVSSVLPARFSSPLSPDGGAAAAGGGGLRGCAAAADLPAGALVLQVPLPLLITYDTAAASDFGKALSRLPGVVRSPCVGVSGTSWGPPLFGRSPCQPGARAARTPAPTHPWPGLDAESLAVTWTMVERHDRDSPHAPFWAALPAAFGTALSVPEPLFGLMRGLPAYQEAAAARRHVRESFQALQQAFTCAPRGRVGGQGCVCAAQQQQCRGGARAGNAEGGRVLLSHCSTAAAAPQGAADSLPCAPAAGVVQRERLPLGG